MKRRGFYFLCALSGMVCLALETIWIRWIGLEVGGSVVAATLVMTCFFFCAAVGNMLAVRILPRVQKPLQAFALSEALFVLSALLTIPILTFFGPQLGGGQSPGRWALLTCLAIALPSVAQGLSFPFISQAFIASRSRRSVTGALFYSINLGGAAFGVIVGGLLLPFYFGFRNAYFLFCGIGLIGAGVAWVLSRGVTLETPDNSAPETGLPPSLAILLVVGMSGVLSIACELILLVWFRQLVASSLQATVAVLSAFILTLGAGSLLVMGLRRKIHCVKKLLTFFLMLNALLVPLYAFVLAPQLGGDFIDHSKSLTLRTLWLCLKATLFLLPLGMSLGTIFPLSWELIRQEQHGRALAQATLVNKCGCAVGAWVASFVFLPLFGLSRALWICGVGYALLLLLLHPLRLFWRRAIPLMLALGFIGIFVPDAVKLESGHRLLKTYYGNNQVVSVTEHEGSRHIMVNQQYMLNGTAASLIWQKQESWIPLFFTPNPQRVCYIGMASGIGANAVLDLPTQELHTLELIPQVKQAAHDYFPQWNQRLFSDPRSEIIIDDGRHFIRDAQKPYDSIICTLFLPSREGSSDLYSQDFFEEVLPRLSEDGTFCLWLPLYQMNAELVNSILVTFRSVFPNAVLLRGNLSPLQPVLGLLGSPNPLHFEPEFLEQRIVEFKQQGIDTSSPFFRNVSMSRLLLVGDLHSDPVLFSGAPINTDNDPYIAFHGDATLHSGEHLRGFTYLNHFGKRFLVPRYPSCQLGATDPAFLLKGIRAGNHAYAASIANVYLPDASAELHQKRQQQVQQHLHIARELLPDSGLTRDDLH